MEINLLFMANLIFVVICFYNFKIISLLLT